MGPSLIFSHIGKTAGSSFQDLIAENYDTDDAWWYGIDQPFDEPIDPDSLNGYRVLGGHFNLPIFNGHFGGALRCSIVREPVERAISLFNYFAVMADDEVRSFWCRLGFDPSSMLSSLRNSSAFRAEVSNRQCLTLSGGLSLEAVHDQLRTGNYVIGVYEQIETFVDTIASTFGWVNRELGSRYVAQAGYREGILQERGLVDLLMEINQEDMALYHWLRDKQCLIQWGNPRHIQKPVQVYAGR